ncbi:MAG: metallophosphoesterase [Planctomycetes bacterium]|nr:metallophosphoesterase [Planctomycetota bacterium]HNZ66941.1 metallophosphoesterase [Planctomycetota bacterium]HPY74009.1 metallophosphoesterase [Planctomycetota bacterium]HQB01190.1 metallophosphoesterase [Planctomycetota bacterium]
MIDNERLSKLKSAYALAIRGNIEDKYRHGELIEFPTQGDVIVLGDLHGNLPNFQKIVQAAQLDSHPNRHLVLQEPTHTYEAKEDKSFLLIDEIVKLKSKYPDRVHIILGNHELSEILGREILKGGICYNILFREGMKKEYGIHYEEIRDLMIDFMKTMPLACISPNKIFISHSTPPIQYMHHYSLDFFRRDAKDPKARAMVEKLVWGRDLTQQAADVFAKRVGCEILIVGHTACKKGFQVPNSRHIILDSKGTFATSIHFHFGKKYTQKYLVEKSMKHINPGLIKEVVRRIKEQEEEKNMRGIADDDEY